MVKRVPAHVERKEEHSLNCLQEPKTFLKGPREYSKNFSASWLSTMGNNFRAGDPNCLCPA